MSKHTTGPWIVEEGISYAFNIRTKYGYSVCVMFKKNLSDARLIAAAPRMYELLAEARKIVRDGKFDSPKGTEWAIDVRDLIREIDGQEDSHE